VNRDRVEKPKPAGLRLARIRNELLRILAIVPDLHSLGQGTAKASKKHLCLRATKTFPIPAFAGTDRH